MFEAPLIEDQRFVLDQVRAHLVAEAPDVMVLAGDVFDRSIPSEEAVALFGAWLAEARAAAPHTPIVIIPGNHDSAKRLAWAAGLLAPSGVHIRAEDEEVHEPVRLTSRGGEPVEVWCIPFLWSGGSAAEGGPVGQVQALEAAIARIRPLQTPGVAQVLVAHCFAQGGRTSQSERTLVGQATLVNPEVFAGFDYVALGHLHRPQSVAPNAHYSGSLAAYSFSEEADTKGVLLVHVAAGTLPSVRALPLRPLRPMKRIQGRLAELLVAPEYASAESAYVEITLTAPEISGNPIALLRSRFPRLLQLLNPEAELAVGEAPPAADRLAGPRTLEADFTDFQAHIGEGRPEDPAVLAAFSALRLRLAAGGGAA